jgi:hypothetical protein
VCRPVAPAQIVSIFDARPRNFATTFFDALTPREDDAGTCLARLHTLLAEVKASGKHEVGGWVHALSRTLSHTHAHTLTLCTHARTHTHRIMHSHTRTPVHTRPPSPPLPPTATTTTNTHQPACASCPKARSRACGCALPRAVPCTACGRVGSDPGAVHPGEHRRPHPRPQVPPAGDVTHAFCNNRPSASHGLQVLRCRRCVQTAMRGALKTAMRGALKAAQRHCATSCDSRGVHADGMHGCPHGT